MVHDFGRLLHRPADLKFVSRDSAQREADKVPGINVSKSDYLFVNNSAENVYVYAVSSGSGDQEIFRMPPGKVRFWSDDLYCFYGVKSAVGKLIGFSNDLPI